MKNQKIIGPFTVPAGLWQEFECKRAECNALSKRLAELKDAMNLPVAKDVATNSFGQIIDGNGNEQGSVTIYWVEEKFIPAMWCRRIN